MPAPSAGGLMLLEVARRCTARRRARRSRRWASARARTSTPSPRRCAARSRIARASRAIPTSRSRPPTARRCLSRPPSIRHGSRHAGDDQAEQDAPAAGLHDQEKGTSHLVVADAEGNVVSLTTTVNGPFGCEHRPRGHGHPPQQRARRLHAARRGQGFGLKDGGPNRLVRARDLSRA